MQDTLTATCHVTSRQRYDVELVSTNFGMPMWEALALVRSSDVFLGMHGAGFANLLGLHKVPNPNPSPKPHTSSYSYPKVGSVNSTS